MMLRRRLSLVLILIAVSGWSCSSPTEPSPTYDFSVIGAKGPYATFATVDGQPSLLEFHVLLDGKDISASSYTHATPVAYQEFAGDTHGVRPGHHSIALKASAQTVSPTVYQSSGIIVTLFTTHGFFSPPTVTAQVTLPEQMKSLQTGESIVIEFDM